MDEQNIDNQQADDNDFETVKKERDEYLDGWQRARAELINYKKDEAKRLESTAKFANEAIVRDLLVVLDSFDLAIMALENRNQKEENKTEINENERGLYLIKSQLEDILKNYGLEKISISSDQIFDPEYHDAAIEVESDKPSGTITEEINKGYILNGKVIRPTRVKIAR